MDPSEDRDVPRSPSQREHPAFPGSALWSPPVAPGQPEEPVSYEGVEPAGVQNSWTEPIFPPRQQLTGQEAKEKAGVAWSMYLDRASKRDRALVENWKGDAEGILIFTGLFAATVAAFIVESYKSLKPDSADTSNAILSRISEQIANASHGVSSETLSPPPVSEFVVPAWSVRVNILWFSSLCLSVTCALWATLVHRWVRNFVQKTQDPHLGPYDHGRTNALIFAGVKKFRMSETISTLPLLLHVSVFLFFAGLVEFLFTVNNVVAWVVAVQIGVVGMAYMTFTVLPLLSSNSPFQTPLSPMIQAFSGFAKASLSNLPRRWPSSTFNRFLPTSADNDDDDVLIPRSSAIVEVDALLEAVQQLRDDECNDFVSSLTHIIDLNTVGDWMNILQGVQPISHILVSQDLVVPSLVARMLEARWKPGTSTSEHERAQRLYLCMRVIWVFSAVPRRRHVDKDFLTLLSEVTLPTAMILLEYEAFRPLLKHSDPRVSISAHCFKALMVTLFLNLPTPDDLDAYRDRMFTLKEYFEPMEEGLFESLIYKKSSFVLLNIIQLLRSVVPHTAFHFRWPLQFNTLAANMLEVTVGLCTLPISADSVSPVVREMFVRAWNEINAHNCVFDGGYARLIERLRPLYDATAEQPALHSSLHPESDPRHDAQISEGGDVLPTLAEGPGPVEEAMEPAEPAPPSPIAIMGNNHSPCVESDGIHHSSFPSPLAPVDPSRIVPADLTLPSDDPPLQSLEESTSTEPPRPVAVSEPSNDGPSTEFDGNVSPAREATDIPSCYPSPEKITRRLYDGSPADSGVEDGPLRDDAEVHAGHVLVDIVDDPGPGYEGLGTV